MPGQLNRPLSDLLVPRPLQTATFSMGCFWGVEALFGCLEGVVRTRVGYAGGSTVNPTYYTIADHIETVQIDYNPARTSYKQLLHSFFGNHKPTRAPYKRQYASAIFYHNQEQEKLAIDAKERQEQETGSTLYTNLYPYGAFYLAENRHQKYKLQRQPALLQEFAAIYPDFSDIVYSSAATRVNGYIAGYGNIQQLQNEINSFGLSEAGMNLLLQKATIISKIRCSG